MKSIKKKKYLFFVLFNCLLSFNGISQLQAAEVAPLRILLTNDDGYDAPGIEAAYAALTLAGHDVTLIAPLENQSGSGVRITTSGILEIREQSTKVWSVSGSPADSLAVGLSYIMKDAPPDLVISGINLANNLGYGSSSGTVGAATAAMYRGYPAIAISAGIIPTERDAEPLPYSSTIDAFVGAGDLIVELIADLQGAQIEGGSLLPDHTILNINYPPLTPEEINGIQITQADRGDGIEFDWIETEEAGVLTVSVSLFSVNNLSESDTERKLFANGFVTITVLDGDWDAGDSIRASVAQSITIDVD